MDIEGLLKSLNDHSARYAVIGAQAFPVQGTNVERVWSRSVVARYGSTEARFASLEDLIEMKEAAGRPRDLEDLKVLRELRKNPEARPGSDP